MPINTRIFPGLGKVEIDKTSHAVGEVGAAQVGVRGVWIVRALHVRDILSAHIQHATGLAHRCKWFSINRVWADVVWADVLLRWPPASLLPSRQFALRSGRGAFSNAASRAPFKKRRLTADR